MRRVGRSGVGWLGFDGLPAAASINTDKLQRYAESGVDEAFFDAFALFTSLDQMLDFASQVIARTDRL